MSSWSKLSHAAALVRDKEAFSKAMEELESLRLKLAKARGQLTTEATNSHKELSKLREQYSSLKNDHEAELVRSSRLEAMLANEKSSNAELLSRVADLQSTIDSLQSEQGRDTDLQSELADPKGKFLRF